MHLVEQVCQAVYQIGGLLRRQRRQMQLNVADPAFRRAGVIGGIQGDFPVGLPQQDRMNGEMDVAIRRGNLAHDRVVEERHVAVRDRQHRDGHTQRIDTCKRFHVNAGGIAVPGAQFAGGVGCGKGEHLGRIKLQVVIAGTPEEQCGIDERLPRRRGDLARAFDLFFAFRCVFAAHRRHSPMRFGEV